MNRSKLKNYAPQARRDFIQAVTDRASYYGLTADQIVPMTEQGDVAIIAGRPHPRAIADKRRKLEKRITQQGFEQTVEAIAYSWFNRFVAIRYMELHGYLDHGYRVLSHPAGLPTPEILEQAEHIDHEHLPGLSRQKVIELKLDGNKEAELYRMLLIAQCNALSTAMPFLFERIDDETELLLPDNLLHSDSLIRKLVGEIDEADWQEVEIIGWLYQFYISEKKDQVIGKVVKSEDIPAATQLFTPNWIVKYLVQNTIGRQWLATYPDSPLRSQMEYYIEPAEQTPEVQAQLAAITPESLNPEEMTLLDPACGSGHILVEAYDLFRAIYQERGYRAKDIPRLILRNNLFGLEIDERAAQLAGFALCMKARADDRRALEGGVPLNVRCIQSSDGLDAEAVYECLTGQEPEPAPPDTEFGFMDPIRTPLFAPLGTAAREPSTGFALDDIKHLLAVFAGENAKTTGSLIHLPEGLKEHLRAIAERADFVTHGDDFYRQEVARRAIPVAEQGLLLSREYDVVVTNPPYMGSKFQNRQLKESLCGEYAEYSKDVFSAFIIRCLKLSSARGCLGFMSPFTWMFISAHEPFRKLLLTTTSLASLVQLEYGGFEGATVPVCTFTLYRTHLPSFTAAFIRLSEFRGADQQAPKTVEAIRNRRCGWFHVKRPDAFAAIPGSPIAYWVRDELLSCFENGVPLHDIVTPRVGMITCNNDRFLRLWWEVPLQHIGFNMSSRVEAQQSGRTWFPYQKGGPYRKWFGNMEYVVNWADDGRLLKTTTDETGRVPAHAFNDDYVFKPNVNWSKITCGGFAARFSPGGNLFDDAGSGAFGPESELFGVLAFLNSDLAQEILSFINPTMNFQAWNIGNLVLSRRLIQCKAELGGISKQLVHLASKDWNRQEVAWDFAAHPFVRSTSIEAGWAAYSGEYEGELAEVTSLEEQANRIVDRSFGIDGIEGRPERKFSLIAPDLSADVRLLLSFAIGCTMGRYSLDKPGLIYAHSGNQGFDELVGRGQPAVGSEDSPFKTFMPDKDGIVPVMEADWFADDAAHRVEQFVRVAWPAEHLEENLAFIAESLGAKKGEPPREMIRRYLACDFFKDHLRTYKRRPIYWLFTSGKQRAFQCLVYLHRYHEGTLSRMRTEYVIPLQGKINTRIDQLEGDKGKATSTAHRRRIEKEQDTLRKQQAELLKFDEKLRHYAEMKITLDLDDGVKVNYGKLGDLLAEVKAVCGKDED